MMRPRATRWALIVALALTACGNAPNLIGIEGPEPATRDQADGRNIRIFIATTRAPSDEPGVFYSGRRSGTIGFATIDVAVPPGHETGNVELPRRPPPDPDRHFVLRNPQRLAGSDAFVRSINAAVDRMPREDRSALIFIHGYNTNLTEAVARFSQLVEDTGYQGLAILFSWPSTRRTIDYVADINSAAFSRDALAMSAALVNRTRLENFDIVAHSMGNFLMMETARTLALQGRFNRLNRLGNVILAAPDIDVDVFATHLRAIPAGQRDKFTVLVSRDDKALRVSRRIAGNRPRVGAVDPEALSRLGITVVDLTQINDRSSIQHSKFADSPEIVQLLGERLATSDTLSTQTTVSGVLMQKVGDVIDVVQVP